MTNPNPTSTLIDATRESYASAFEAWNQAQARALRWSRLWLDEIEASQNDTRRMVNDLLQVARQSQEAFLGLSQDNLRNVSSVWRWPTVTQFDELNSRLDELNRKVDQQVHQAQQSDHATLKVSKS